MTPSTLTPSSLESAQRQAETGEYEALNRLAAECAGWTKVSMVKEYGRWDVLRGTAPPEDGFAVGEKRDVPNFCESVDAVKQWLEKPLIERGWAFELDFGDAGCRVDGTRFATSKSHKLEVSAYSTTEPIARTIASIRAHLAEREGR